MSIGCTKKLKSAHGATGSCRKSWSFTWSRANVLIKWSWNSRSRCSKSSDEKLPAGLVPSLDTRFNTKWNRNSPWMKKVVNKAMRIQSQMDHKAKPTKSSNTCRVDWIEVIKSSLWRKERWSIKLHQNWLWKESPSWEYSCLKKTNYSRLNNNSTKVKMNKS